MGTSIFACDKSVDINVPVIKWDESGGFSFYGSNSFSRRNISFDDLSNRIHQFTSHWSVTYRAKNTFTGLKDRNLSVNFIIDDDCDNNGYATIYQCLDIKDIGWSQGGVYNGFGSGVEISYQPEAWDKPNLYSSDNQNKYHVPNHDIGMGKVHGTQLKVFLPTKAQTNSLKALIFGYCSLFPKVLSSFPKNNDASYNYNVIPNITEYYGLLNHYNFTKEKIDTAGLDLADIEHNVIKMLKVGF